jgi:hypothetical protein
MPEKEHRVGVGISNVAVSFAVERAITTEKGARRNAQDRRRRLFVEFVDALPWPLLLQFGIGQ